MPPKSRPPPPAPARRSCSRPPPASAPAFAAGVSATARARSFDLQPHRAVVAAHYLRGNPRAPQRRPEFLAGDEVIDAPPDVPAATVHHLAPPRIVARPFFEFAKRVHEALCQELGEIPALFIREPR